ncbi:MAG TPA: 5-(carboxyamino)imidazole ribonucleotide synthase [Blastocatellia bacterium]|nr:5-(carboxyamino)imidazole ribonucleotide synthase [Blastocatellia bacterium]
MSRIVLPGATIGVLGSGQLGRMFAIAARRLGYRVHTFSPDSDTPTGQISDYEYDASYDDLDRVRQFASGVSVVTFEFENVPAATVEAASELAPVHPSGAILHIAQHRLREKTFLSQSGFPVVNYRHVRSMADLLSGLQELGYPAVLKTAGYGYDGKGQSRIDAPEDAQKALDELKGQEAVLEAFVDFACEISVVAARCQDGSFAHFEVAENSHRRHILDISVAPAHIPDQVSKEAVEITRNVLEKLDLVGVMCVEFFLTKSGKLLINELAPRPHNSGHLTVDACITSQFEQQLRAVCGLPLGSTQMHSYAAMANLLGDIWQRGEPDWAAACAFPEVKLHLYGKMEPRVGRKMGHLTALAATREDAVRIVKAARSALDVA